MIMENSWRRVGAEGERVNIATLYVNVNDSAREAQQISLKFENTPFFTNWLAIRNEHGINTTDLLAVTEVTPIVITNALLRIQNQPTVLGDANLDYQVDLSDAVVILGDLFLGSQNILCPEAADFNDDHMLNISDPIAILSFLFLGSSAPASQKIYCNGHQ